MGTDDQPPAAPFTAWHVFLVQLLSLYADQQRLELRDFDKLGTLPLEADVILIRRTHGADSGPALLGDDFAFLASRLGDLTVLEYKGPTDTLTREDVDTVQVYGLLAKRKYKLPQNRQVRLMLLYSYAQRDLFDLLAADGLPFDHHEEEGIRCYRGSMVIYAIDLLALGRRMPQNPLNLLSSRHAHYVQSGTMSRQALAVVHQIRYLIQQGKGRIRGMSIQELTGGKELLEDMEVLKRRFLEVLDPEERLEGLGPEERLRGLGPKERLRGLDPKERSELLTLLLAEQGGAKDPGTP